MSEIEKIVESIKSGTSSARQEVEKALQAAKDHKNLHAFLEIFEKEALQRADQIDARIKRGEPVGRLAGVPYAAKDNFLTTIGHTTAAARMLENFCAPLNATAIERLDAEGAILIGKTNLDAFANGSSTESSAFGPTHNAVDPERVPGGTSGGSAAAVAAGIVPFALGSDTGGSIRQPASFNGVVGLRPTYGMISRHGVIAFASSTDVVGALTRTVADTEIICEILAGPDGRDSTILPEYFNNKKTTYFLCGGNDRKYENFFKKLAKEITKIVETPRILDVFFAKPEQEWKNQLKTHTDFYDKYFKNYTHQMATLENFYDQIKNADVIYFHGGSTELLLEKLPDFGKVEEAIQGKIYVGSSAGANYLSKHFLNREKIVVKGSGILPINIVVHYESDDPDACRSKAQADEFEKQFPIKTLRIREGEFEIITESEINQPLKIGLIKDFLDKGVDPDVIARTRDFANKLKQAGHTVEEVDFTMSKYSLAIYYIVVLAELSSNLARYDGVRYGLRAADAKSLNEIYGHSRDAGFMPENKRRIMIGAFVLSSGYYDAYYLQAQKARTLLIQEFNKLFEKYDFLIGPVAPTPAFKLGQNTSDPVKMYLEDIMTIQAPLAGIPALSLPNGTSKTGLPIGVQIFGPMKSDAKLLDFAKSMEEKSEK